MGYVAASGLSKPGLRCTPPGCLLCGGQDVAKETLEVARETLGRGRQHSRRQTHASKASLAEGHTDNKSALSLLQQHHRSAAVSSLSLLSLFCFISVSANRGAATAEYAPKALETNPDKNFMLLERRHSEHPPAVSSLSAAGSPKEPVRRLDLRERLLRAASRTSTLQVSPCCSRNPLQQQAAERQEDAMSPLATPSST